MAACSEQELLDLVLHLVDLSLELRLVVVEDDCSHDVSADSAGSSEVGLLSNVHVGDVLVLAQEWQVEDDLEGLGVGGKHDQVCESSVQALSGLVGALLELLVKHGLVAEIEDLLLHLVVGLGPSAGLLSFDGGFLDGLDGLLALLVVLLL